MIPNAVQPSASSNESDSATALRDQFGLDEQSESILFVGRLEFAKGPDILLRALPPLLEQRPRAQVLIAGDGPMRQQCTDLLAEMKLTDRVQLLGSRGDVRKLMSHVAVVVIPSRCSDLILSQNSEDVETAVRDGICESQKIRRLGNGIDVSQFDPDRVDPPATDSLLAEFSIPSGSPVVGFVGRLVEEKGVREFLQAARIILRRFPEARFLLVGPSDPAKADAIDPALASEYGVAHACVFCGRRSDMATMA